MDGSYCSNIFAFFSTCVGLFGIGTFTQVNGINLAINDFFNKDGATPITIPGIGSYSIYTVVISIIIAVLVGVIIFGGIKRISMVSSFFAFTSILGWNYYADEYLRLTFVRKGLIL